MDGESLWLYYSNHKYYSKANTMDDCEFYKIFIKHVTLCLAYSAIKVFLKKSELKKC